MDILYTKKFEKEFLKLPRKQQEKVDETISLFRHNPHNPQLRNHSLHGELLGCRAISAGGDLRLVFEVMGNYERVQFLMAGTHSQVY